MRILLLTHAFNSLAQRLFVELRERGHDVTVELDINDAVTREAVELAGPDLVIAPFLKRAIAESVWRQVPCFIVHPGIRGDRGPSSLDWAILDAETCLGRHGVAGGSGDGCRPGVGLLRVPDAGRSQVEPSIATK